jgi:hypothetical protein
MGKKQQPTAWPESIANWMAFNANAPWLGSHEIPLYTDARITGQITTGPYTFLNTLAVPNFGEVRPAVVLRYAVHKAWDNPDFRKTDSNLYHGGTQSEEVAALVSLVLGMRLRAGRIIREFEPLGDPMGRPSEFGEARFPAFRKPHVYNIPAAAGEHSLMGLEALNVVLTMSQSQSITIVRAARLYQEALWLSESEPEMSWLLLVSAIETAANEWQHERDDDVERLCSAKPDLHAYLSSLGDQTILGIVATHLSNSLGITDKFVNFVMTFLPDHPTPRPPKVAQFEWRPEHFKKALRVIYGYRSRALHDGLPFPPPMCSSPFVESLPVSDGQVYGPAETMTALGTSERGGIWLKEDIPMNLHLFEYIVRNVLLKWWRSL